MFECAIASLIVALMSAGFGFTQAVPAGATSLANMIFPWAMSAFVASTMYFLLVGDGATERPTVSGRRQPPPRNGQ